MKKKIEVKEHWYTELGKVRAWLEGFKYGVGDKFLNVPGVDTLRQIQLAIKETLVEKDKHEDSFEQICANGGFNHHGIFNCLLGHGFSTFYRSFAFLVLTNITNSVIVVLSNGDET